MSSFILSWQLTTSKSIYNFNRNDDRMLDETIGRAKRRYYKLVILVGSTGSGKTDIMLHMSTVKGYPYVNLNLELSRNLLDVSVEERPSHIQKCVEGLLPPTADIILLDNTELLFTPELQIDPLRLFQKISREKTLIVSWNGTYSGETLIYGEPSRPEYRVYTRKEVDAEIYPLNEEVVN